MPESSIQVTSHLRLLIPSHSSLATHPCFQTSEFRVLWRLRRKYIGDARLPFSSLFPSKSRRVNPAIPSAAFSMQIKYKRLSPHVPRTSPFFSSVFHAARTLSAPTGHLPLEGKAIKLSGRTFLAPHRGSSPKGLCKRTGFLGVKRRENPVRRHFERSEMRGLRSDIA